MARRVWRKWGAHVFDVVITDVNLPKLDGVSLLKRVRAQSPSTGVVLITAFGEIAQAVAALKEGAYDYLAKPFDLEELLVRLGTSPEQRKLETELEQARATLAGGRRRRCWSARRPRSAG